MSRWRRGLVVCLLLCLAVIGLDLVRWPAGEPSSSTPTSAPTQPPGSAPPPVTDATDGPGFIRADPPAGPPRRTEPDPTPGRRPPGGDGSRRILVGANVEVQSGESWLEANARADTAYGPLAMHRVFYPDLPPPWEGSRAAGGGRTVVVSFKAAPRDILAGSHDALLAEWFRTAPRDRDIYWVYYHEPEDNIEAGEFNAADYRAAWRRLGQLADDADHPRLHATLVLMCWTLESGSGRDWRDYYAGEDVIAVLGWDCYNSAGQRGGYYIDPAQRFESALAVSRQAGKPWGIAEFGSELIAGDESGEGRAAWLREVGEYLSSLTYPPLWVAYFDSTVAGDFRLRDRPSQRAWQQFAQAHGSG